VAGLLTMAVGAFLFLPAASLVSYPLFLTALMILGAGITCWRRDSSRRSLRMKERLGRSAEPGSLKPAPRQSPTDSGHEAVLS
jgi:hypothetical protein